MKIEEKVIYKIYHLPQVDHNTKEGRIIAGVDMEDFLAIIGCVKWNLGPSF